MAVRTTAVCLYLIAAVSMLTACDRKAEAPAPAASASPAASDALARIDSLSRKQLDMVLFRALRDAGQDCQDVTNAERLEDQDGRHLYRVTCRGGGQWAIQIGSDGTANVTGPAAPRP